MEDTKSIPANRSPLTERLKRLKELTLRSVKPHGEEKGEVEHHETEHRGNVVGNITTVDGEMVEHQASADMQESGEDEKVARAAAGKDAKPVKTVSSLAAKQADDAGPAKPKESKDQPTANGDREAKSVDLSGPKESGTDRNKSPGGSSGKGDKKSLFKPESMKVAEGDFKAETKSEIKAPKQSGTDSGKNVKADGKPDKSMSKMAQTKSGETSGADKLSKGEIPPPRKQYDIESKPGELNYKQKEQDRTISYAKKKVPVAESLDYSKYSTKPSDEPKWKQKVRVKTPEQKAEFHAKLVQERSKNPKQPGVKKDVEKSASYNIEEMAQALSKAPQPTAAGGGWRNVFGALKKNAVAGYPEMGIAGGTPEAALAQNTMMKSCKYSSMKKAGPAAPAFKAPALPKPAAPKMGKMDEKKQQLLQMARMGKPRPQTSTPLGHALANYTDPNSFSFDPRFAALIQRVAPAWAKK